MAKKKNNAARTKSNVTIGTISIWVAAFVNAPRYAGAFLYSDVQSIPPIIAQILDWANVTAGLAMGILEVVSMALLMDNLRRTSPKIVTKIKKRSNPWDLFDEPKYVDVQRRVINPKWVITAFWGIGLIVLAPFILVPYMDARSTAQSMHELMLEFLTPENYLSGLSAWNFFVVLAPIFVIGGASFAQVSVTHSESQESSESSEKVSAKFPNDWRKLTDDQKKILGKMDAKKISENTGLTLRGAQNWERDLKEQGY